MTAPRKLSVLVADDVWGVRESPTAALAAEGYEVVSVADGQQASAALAARAFDVLVCDLWMPGVGGIQVLRGAAEQRPGMSMEGATSLAEVWGAEKVFLKPFDERELVAFLQTPSAG